MSKILRLPTCDAAPFMPAAPAQGVPPGCCRDCKFWHKKPSVDVTAEEGECRYGPPVMFAVGAQVIALAPQCAGSFGCFQFQARETQ